MNDISAANATFQIPSGESNAVNQQDDWQFAALVIDRLCFFFCVVYIAIVTTTFYAFAILANQKQTDSDERILKVITQTMHYGKMISLDF